MDRTLVVKIGTSSLTRSVTGQLALSTIAALVETLAHLRASGDRVVLVSSGAVGVGCARLGLVERPRRIARKQAIAAVGQGRLMRVYDDLFANLQQPIAQVLLTRRDLMQRNSYVNAYNAFQEIFELGAIPIVNENDTVATDELKFGDNDTLSALVASLLEADWLILLTDVDRLYSSDPRLDPGARPIRTVSPEELDDLQVNASGSGSGWGTGGMATKLAAARLASSAGVRTAIAHGRRPEAIEQILAGEPHGTQFEPRPRSEPARKRWIAYGLVTSGTLTLDWGAVQALRDRGKSLLAAGITAVTGEFLAGDAVALCTPDGKEFARGLSDFDNSEVEQIRGRQSTAIPLLLGYAAPDTVVHRDNLVLLGDRRTAPAQQGPVSQLPD
ncbi:glutamate 5-kinase [Rubidibacter lacunae KORDI 51-2]|uniref:Glutamate 5-kinase n=1 Tax=Rubidibacter lacunae KORDI 51-2 TaxID=582515 RepID=U5DLT9_9CHRO|nr:glutamate 5-kinase [Rubidibacter lacunae]ERN42616.1 glutamate 5-kinase [Rubidibacter lacunae KORDI 51-2]